MASKPATEPSAPAKTGRPSKYIPAFCEEIISLMGEGLSLTAAAAELNIHRQTIYAWEEEIPEFSDAVKLARGKRLLHLERGLFKADGSQVTAHIFALKNACAAEWREKTTTELTGKDGGPIQTEDISAIDALESRIAGIAARSPGVNPKPH